MNRDLHSAKRRARACCCLPIPVGVILLSVTGTVLGVGLGTIGILATNKLDAQLEFDAKMALQMHIFQYILLAIFSTLGFIAVARKSRKVAGFHFSSYAAHLPFNIGSGAFLLHILFAMKGGQVLEVCTHALGDSKAKGIFLVKDVCNQNASAIRGASVAVLVVIYLWEFYSLFILNSYTKELAQVDYKVDEYVISP